MATPAVMPSGLPDHFEKEWALARDLIEKQDERIHDTRKLVFGLFPALLTAGSILGAKLELPSPVWLGLHLTLLGLLVTGRFIEQQSFLLQAAAASRVWVLELLTPVELSGTISDRFASGWPRRTTYIYVALGLVSLLVTALAGDAPAARQLAGSAAITVPYIVYVAWLGHQDISYARSGQDWSFDTVSCTEGDPVSILLVNQCDKPMLPPRPVAELRRVFDAEGNPTVSESVPFVLPDLILETGRTFPPRRACRWVWRASKAGVWALQVNSDSHAFARRFIHVRKPRTRRQLGLIPSSDEEVDEDDCS
jgi:hypothetical protein